MGLVAGWLELKYCCGAHQPKFFAVPKSNYVLTNTAWCGGNQPAKDIPRAPLCSSRRNKCAALLDDFLCITGFVTLALCDRVKIAAFFYSFVFKLNSTFIFYICR